MNDSNLLEEIERYLNGEMTPQERKQFELLRKGDTAINNKIAEHEEFAKILKQYGDRLALETRLNAIHDEIDVHTLAEELIVHPSRIVRLWRNHHSKISVAASIAIFAILSTLFITGNLSNQESKYIQLRREVGILKQKTETLNKKAAQGATRTVVSATDRFRGTGFAITSGGLIATNYHVVNGADSVYVQNAVGKSFKAKVLYTEPQNDIAILKIVDTSFRNLGAIPYTFKKSESDLAEDVYTYGFPQDSPVYGYGKLTAANGLNGDSLDYQISVPINPGNSGGPLMDGRGNVIGIVQAKQSQLEGVHFAIKSSYLINAIQNIPADSLNKKISLNTKNTLGNLNSVQQLKKLKNYVFMVKVYDK
ncbi:Trypsin-like peptidase domain-containing protein [Mucilaginibacter mallensis]|uniref:Trypsin-like peptidase domain-containing protein n=1 Tax=Mucilaginibacter mallensis TaxID=652787 RepID=A0A1H1ZWM1_MUCMA|nr:serine protease [Mucilaginibacter mallensis]SDT38053.1 Trypsin-like peptidase domain-containing protein [Mucilaginibacter mallensis]